MNEHRIAGLMRRQYGLISQDQLTDLDVPRWHVRRRLESGEWQKRRPGVYALAGMPPSADQSLVAVVLACHGDAIVSHASAASVWRFPHVEAASIEVSSVLTRLVRLDGVTGHRSCLLFDDDVRTHRRIPVTSQARTVVDLSARFDAARLGKIVDDALRHGMRLRDLRRCIGRLAPAPGRRPSVVHKVLAKRLEGYDPGDSDLETKVLRWLIEAGFPPPRQQLRIRINGRTFKIDLAYPELRIAIELDSWEWHGMGLRTPFDHDRTKITQLTIAGWRPIVFTSSSSRDYVIESVREARDRFVQSSAV